MSVNSLVRSYIHQHNMMHMKAAPPDPVVPRNPSAGAALHIPSSWSSPLPLAPPAKRTSLASRFPFNECTSLELKELRLSLKLALRCSVRKTNAPQLKTLKMHSPLVAPAAASDTALVSRGKMSPEPTESILIKDEAAYVQRAELVRTVRGCFRDVFMAEAGLTLENKLVEAVVNYSTNMFLQEFPSGVVPLRVQIQAKQDRGDLTALLLSVVEAAEDKHEQQCVEELQDMIAEQVAGATMLDSTGLYDAFKRVWCLNKQAFLSYELQDVLLLCYTSDERQFTHASVNDLLLADLEDTAVEMNMIRFYYTYKWELARQRGQLPHGASARVGELERRLLLSVQTLVEQDHTPGLARPRKHLRFDTEAPAHGAETR